jgi:carboxymethylenebutenolidase
LNPREVVIAEWMNTTGEGPSVPAYVARPVGRGSFPGVILLHHIAGLDQGTRECAYRIATHGYIVVAPDLHATDAPGLPLEEAAARVKSLGGVADATMLSDVSGAQQTLRVFSNWNGRVGLLGFCSGGRQAYVAAATLTFDAAVICYGTRIVAAPEDLTERRPVSALSMTEKIQCPVRLIFGEKDPISPPAHAAAIESELVRFRKEYELEVYRDAGHAFLDAYRDTYSAVNAKLAWERIFAFLDARLH